MEDFDKIHFQLCQMLQKLESNQSFRKFLKKTSQKLNFQKNNFLNLTAQKVQNMHLSFKSKIICQKQKINQCILVQSSTWLQNQLRMFIYIMCGHLYLKKISIFQLKQQDFQYLSLFFPLKRREHLQYQIKLLTCNKNIKWSTQESKLFEELMKKNKDSKRWNHIAKELFILSNKKYFKTPKQCRQRWINHIDPSKLKGNWSLREDQVIIKSVIGFGKKWTLISTQLKNTRTENSVKNRYNSLIKFAKKQHGFDHDQQTLLQKIFQNLTQQVQNNHQPAQQNTESQNISKLCQLQNQMTKIDVSQSFKVTVQNQVNKHGEFNEKAKEIQQQQRFQSNCQNQQFSYEPKYMLDQSQQIQNIAWNYQQSHQIVNGSLCFEQNYIL